MKKEDEIQKKVFTWFQEQNEINPDAYGNLRKFHVGVDIGQDQSKTAEALIKDHKIILVGSPRINKAEFMRAMEANSLGISLNHATVKPVLCTDIGKLDAMFLNDAECILNRYKVNPLIDKEIVNDILKYKPNNEKDEIK